MMWMGWSNVGKGRLDWGWVDRVSWSGLVQSRVELG